MTRTAPHTQPATRRFFYACIAALALLTGCDDLDAHAASQADLADAIAQAAKEAAHTSPSQCAGYATTTN